MVTFTVLYDACVLYPAPLRDLLVQLAAARLFRARWTDQIHEEWIRNLLAKRNDLTREQLSTTRKLMDAAVPDCLVTGYEPLIAGLTLPDPNDRHVLAAAIRANASVIVTSNLKDFPAPALTPFEIEAQHPDDFLVYQFDLATAPVCSAVKRIRGRLQKPAVSVDQYLATLSRNSLPQFTTRLERFADLL